MLKNRNAGRGQYLRGSGQRQVVGCCDHRNDVRVLQTAGNFSLRNHELVTNDSAQWI